ncbi:MAG: ATP-dependent metallopeptidase FtsH/Yme1/Tma family protein [Candidatus Methylomirabilis oxyfera]|nr:ATP-dependent metallopeptidase FtsH/Yme1/Tma family protein [Candidatus Methylomirabilis oxyfera]
MNKRYLKVAGVVALILVVTAVAFLPFYWNPKKASSQVIFSDFMDLVENGQLAGTVIFNENSHTIYFHIASGQHLRTVYSKEATASLQELLKKKSVHFAVEPQSGGSIWLGLLFNFLPFIVIIGLFVLMSRRSQMGGGGGGPMAFGKSKAKLHDASKPKVTFADVAGEEEPKEELLEVIEFLKHPQKYQALHAKIPRGLLLVGPPGCGKTLLAKAVAGEAGVPFFSLSGSEFVEVFVGVGASRVRDLFEQAKKNAPCLVFIDEIDAVGRHRGAGLGGGNDEREQTLNQLLVAMDGFEANIGIIVIAATNRPDILDPALLRPGRFDRRIIVDNPDSKGRKAILQVHLREIPLGPDVNVDVLAKQTPGFSGADLASVVNEGALLAARRDKDRVSMVDFDEAVERVIAGPLRRSRALTPKEREMVAYHEAGHAILRKLLPKADPPHKVTIVSRGMALGYVMGAPPEDRYTRTRSELLSEVSVGMGGRVAEDLVFGEITTGASNDFEQATNMVRRMVTNFGMSDKLGPVTLGRQGGPVFLGRDMIDSRNYSEEIAYQIDQEVRRIIDECYQVARQTIEANREKLNRVAKALIERETLFAEELDDVMAGKVVALEPSRAASGEVAAAVDAGAEHASPSAPSSPVPPPA